MGHLRPQTVVPLHFTIFLNTTSVSLFLPLSTSKSSSIARFPSSKAGGIMAETGGVVMRVQPSGSKPISLSAAKTGFHSPAESAEPETRPLKVLRQPHTQRFCGLGPVPPLKLQRSEQSALLAGNRASGRLFPHPARHPGIPAVFSKAVPILPSPSDIIRKSSYPFLMQSVIT